ncbi:Fibronectin type III domain-containing protein [Streptosporangium subroseum]|uniref:Fibronectin type III domain-containing protein n=1 Tax=Streptosporangium subroseum TaxID=106412 RepID=A0A239NFJ9_9ACTN|nr:discoidin domain-containing protein [Streptosporangium subroseum]SNT53302.1 Fibronectin type III domain-containing protein [Streptosporangium subroseum]
MNKLRRTLRVALGAILSAVVVTAAAVPSIAAVQAAPAGRQIHVAKDGKDTNAGTAAAPYLTINHAAQEAQPGDTVVVHAGLYRETVKPARGGEGETSRITYTNAGDGEAVIKGSEEIDTWVRQSGDVWKVTLPATFFGDYNPYATGQPQGGEGGAFPGYTAGDVYLNEQAYYEKASLDKVAAAPDTWYSEVSGGTTVIYANFDGADPNAKLAEINVRRQVFAPDAWGLGYITVHGFTVKHAAGTYSDFPSSPSRRQAGAISVNGGLKWIIENNTVVNARTIAIDIGLGCDEWAGNRPGQTRTNFRDTDKYGSHIVRNNYIAKSGQSGIAGVFSWNSDIQYNMIEDTNYRGEFSGAETAPIKVHYMNEGLIQGNYIKNSKGGNSAGIWTDWGNQNVRITGNIVMNSPWGYYAEAVHGPILVDNNVFIGNSDIRMLDATGVVFANNLFVDNGRINVDGGGRDAYYFQPGTMNETTAPTSVQKFFWYNNLVQGSTLPADASGKTQVKEGNSTGALSGIQVTATNREVKLGFDLDASGISGLTPVTKARVGVIPNAGESIAADVTTDFFGNPINAGNVMAGPFAGAKDGANSFTLWPPAGQTVPTPPEPPVDVPVNLSRGADAKAVASYQDGNLLAANAIDGNGSSRWSTDHSNDPNAWIYVDLGDEYDVSRAVLSWEAAYAKSYKIQVSDDAEKWSDVYTTTTGGGGVETVPIRKTARYVRMQGVLPNTPYGYSLYEFEVYGTPAVPEAPVNVALNLPPSAYTASSQSNDGSGEHDSQPQNDRSAFRAFDGNPATRWGSGGGDGNWIQVDLGKTHVLDKVVLTWESAYSSTYKIQTSEDGSTWKDVRSHDDSSPTGDHTDEIALDPPAEGRYVRMQGTKAATQWGLSLYEFEVYGTVKPADTAPDWPASAQLQVSAVTGTSATATWPAATDSQAVTGYKVYLGQALKSTLGADARSYAVTGLAAGRTYTVKVTALDANGNESGGLTKTFTTSGNPATRALSTSYPRTYADWEDGLLAGDGKQGIIVFGDPNDETVVFNDRDFFMARSEARPHRTFNAVSQANIKKIRDLVIAGKYQEANQLAADVQGYQGGGEGSKHPGFKMTLKSPATGEVVNYVRSTDYSSGVVSVNWSDDKGDWKRDSFVSQTDGATVQYLPAPAGQKLDVKLGLSIDPGMNLLNKGLTAVNNSTVDYLNLRVKYPNGSYNAGYEGVTRIVTDGVKTMSGTDVQVTGATYVTLLSLTQRYDGTYEGGVPAEQEWNKQLLQTKLAALSGDYQTLLSRHVAKHSEIFNRVSVDFGASPEDRSKSNEELLAAQKTATTPNLALFERMFNSGRYHLLASSSPTAAPDLLGNWTGDSNVGWDGYYHLDANLNLQISGGNIGNMPEAMQGYWWLNKQWQEDFRTNAQKLLGTRGMLTGGNTPNGEGLISNINFDYPYQYVTGGESWLLYPFWEHYQVTGDRKFLEEQYYPLIRDMGDFYEDFLVEKDANGKYIFAGSISPENRPAGGVPLSVNSVYDISGARFALSTLIETSKLLSKDQDKIAVWQEKLDNLPPYLVNNDGALAEWASPDLANKNNYQHRHSSGLMPVWPYREITPEKNKTLYDAAKVFLQKKDGGNYENAGHGLLHGALIAADLNNAESVNAKLMRFAKDDYYYSSLATSHYNNHGVFATDVVNSVPTIMMEMLAKTDPGTLELLPALPKGLKKGSISGMLGKSRFSIDDLDWDMDTRKVKVTLTSDVDQNLTLIQRAGIEEITSADIQVQNSPLGGIARVLPLKKDQTVTLELTLKDTTRVNLAQGKTARASSESSGDYTAAKAFDGDPATRWSASESADNWLQVDLGGIYALNEVDLSWEDSYAKRYRLQVSMDGTSWKDVHTQSDSRSGTEKIPVSALGRYVRMQGVQKAGQWGYSLYEMEVYGQEAPNIALGKTATASSASNAQQTAVAAFDGDGTTRWGASESADNWLQVDLGDTYTVYQVAINWEDSYAKGYKLQTSPDGQKWTDAFTETAGNGGTDLVDLNADTRYIRMQGTAKAGQWGYSIYEMKVYGALPDTGTTILISGVADGVEYGDSQDVTIAWEVAGAGIKTVTGTLDDQPFTSGTVQQLHKLALGDHTLTVTVEAQPGGTYEQSVTFTTVTSTDEISALIERLQAAGQLSPTGAAKLQDKISKVMVSEDKERERDKKKIVKKLDRFIEAANDPKIISDSTVKATLIRDANSLIVENGGTPV